MISLFNVDEIKEPETYMREGRECYLDASKKILRIKNPEETVRQKLITYLNTVLRVPVEAIETEIPLSHYSKGARGRMDLVIYAKDEELVAVFECKAPNIMLTDDVLEQVDGYAKKLDIPLVGITNGYETELFYYNKNTLEYEIVSPMPRYKQMCDPLKLETMPITPRQFKRFDLRKPLEEIYDYASSEGILGEGTPEEFSPYVVNLDNCFIDTSVRLENIEISGVKFIKDIGVRTSRFGNAGGGAFEGFIRSFMIKKDNGDTQIFSFSLWGLPEVHDNHFNQKGNTSLVVAVDDFEKHHNALEMCFNKCADITSSPVEFYHDGRITVGNKGAAKRSGLVEFVRKRQKNLIRNNQIYLGAVDFNKELSVGDRDIQIFLSNLITYAKLRDDFRATR